MKWANANSLDERVYSLEYYTENHSFALIMPQYDLFNRKSAKQYVNAMCSDFFFYALIRWNSDKDTWPRDLGPDTFNKWFTVEYIYNVIE